MHGDPSARTNPTAVVAFVASLLGFVCLFGVGGVLAVVLGLVAKAEIRRSEPRERGGGLATAAVAIGLVQVAAAVVGVGIAIATLVRPEPVAMTHVPSVARAPAPVPTRSPTPSPTQAPAEAPDVPATPDTRERERAIGAITLVDLGAESGSLARVFERELQKARASGGQAIAFVVTAECSPCNGVALALGDRRLQRALAGSRLVRIDVRERAEELVRLGIPVETVPGLALLAPGARPADYLHGGEWDADVPDNIAPVLTDFVQGGKRPRRYPWRGVVRPDETAL